LQLQERGPLKVLERGYAIATDSGGNVLTDSARVQIGEMVHSPTPTRPTDHGKFERRGRITDEAYLRMSFQSTPRTSSIETNFRDLLRRVQAISSYFSIFLLCRLILFAILGIAKTIAVLAI